MTRKKKDLLEQDSTLRLIYAFNHFIENNDSWQSDSVSNAQNREISTRLGYELDDAYFVFNGRFYSFNYAKKDEDTISCEMKEYNNAYELADEMTVLSFAYVLPTQEIENVCEKKVSLAVEVRQTQKVMK